MNKLTVTILIMLVILFIQCKKNSRTEDSSPQAIVDTTLDATISEEQAEALATITLQNIDEKHLVMPNGQKLYDYLEENNPSLLNLKNIKSVKASNKFKTTGIIRTPENERLFIIGSMAGMGRRLTLRSDWVTKITQNGGNQPKGLAYVYGGKNFDKSMVSSPNDDGSPANCQKSLYGLDCSGFMVYLLKAAELPLNGKASYLANPKNWNNCFKQLGYEDIIMKEYLPGTLNLQNDVKNGDIIYWGPSGSKAYHIGMIIFDEQNRPVVYASNGTPKNSCEKNEAGGPSQVFLTEQVWKMTRKNSPLADWGILRMTVPKVEYTRTTNLPSPRSGMAAAGLGNTILFAGGSDDKGTIYKTVDIYDDLNENWTSKSLSEPKIKLAAAAAGKKIIIGGGDGLNAISSSTDVFDTNDGTLSPGDKLSLARYHLAAAGAGNRIVFAGGDAETGKGYSSVVDIYDGSTGRRISTTTLPGGGRRKFAGAATGDFVLLAGGEGENVASSARVDVFNTSAITNQWSLRNLTTPTYGLSGAGTGGYVIFTKGGSMDGPCMFDMSSSSVSSPTTVTPPHPFNVVASVGNFVVCGGNGTVDVYNTVKREWKSLANVKSNLIYTIAASNDKTVMLGGRPLNSTSMTGVVTKVDILTLKEN